MKNKIKIGAAVAASILLPISASAQQLTNLQTLVGSIGSIITKLIPIMFAIALLGFFYGLVMYIFSKDADKDQAKKTMIWGVVALFVMASVWGLVKFIGDAVGVGTGVTPDATNLIPKGVPQS